MDVTFHVVEGVVGVGVPIGRPVWNTRVLVLDSRVRGRFRWVWWGSCMWVGCRWLGGMRVVWI